MPLSPLQIGASNAQITNSIEATSLAASPFITTSTFTRTVGASPNTAAVTIPVTITLNGVSHTGNNLFNLNGDPLQLFEANPDANALVVWTRSDNVVDATKTVIDSKIVNIGGTETTQHSTTTRNAANEILQITPWA